MNHSEIRVASGRSTLPSDWEVPEIDEHLQEISMGPFGSDIKVDNFVSAGVPVLNGSNLRSHKLTGPFRNFVTAEKAKALKKAVASKGDIVVTHRGTLGQVAYIPDELEHERFVVSQSQFRARFDRSKVDPRWVPLYFLSTQGQAALLEKKGHTGVPAISSPTKTFRALRLPLPAIHEQRRIVAAINDVEAEIEGLERLIAKKRDIKRAAMQQLLAGKTRLPGFTAAWDTKSIGEIADIVSGGTPKTSEPAYWNGSVLWCTPTDITAIPGKYLTSTEALDFSPRERFCSAVGRQLVNARSPLAPPRRIKALRALSAAAGRTTSFSITRF